MRYYIIAGEKSGDLHGGGICQALRAQDPSVELRGVGGEAMASAGVALLFHYQQIALMGFSGVLKHFMRLRKLLVHCRADLVRFQPDAILLIDSAGFNLRVARYAHRHYPVPIFYLIPPKTWAWGGWRNRELKKLVRHLFVTLPFEKDYFEQQGLPVSYLGSPLVRQIDAVEAFTTAVDREIVALLPGSRVDEITRHLPLMISVARDSPNRSFVICGLKSISSDIYRSQELPDNVTLVLDQSYEVLQQAKAAVVVSGTATLETAILQVPQVVIYKTGRINYLLARMLVKIRFISLVNLVMGREVVKELIQGDCTPGTINVELTRILEDEAYSKRIIDDYRALRDKLPVQDTYALMAQKIGEMVGSGRSKLTQT